MALSEGIVIPRWDPFRCGGFGCPNFIYMYTLPYYFVSIFHFLGFSFIASLKLLLAISFILSGIGMYFLAKSLGGEKAGLVAGILYLYAPYHLSDLHFSSDIGEMLAFTILPFTLLLVKYVIESKKLEWIFLLALSLLLLILSHHVILISSLPLILGFSAVNLFWLSKKSQRFAILKRLCLAFILGILFSTFYWLPILTESSLIYWGKYGTVSFIEPISMFFVSPWRYGFLFQGPKGQLSFIIGYVHLILIAAAAIVLIKNFSLRNKIKNQYYYLLLFFCLTLAYFFFMMKVSDSLWQIIPLIKKFQFSYRLLILIAFTSSVLAGLLLRNSKNIIIWILLLLAITSTILNWGNRRTIPEIDDSYLINELMLREPLHHMTVPVAVRQDTIDVSMRPLPRLEAVTGEPKIVSTLIMSTLQNYTITTAQTSTVKANTFFYPGWSATLNGSPIEIKTTQGNQSGMMFFIIPAGTHELSLSFSDTFTRKAGDFISFISISTAFYFLVIRGKKLRSK